MGNDCRMGILLQIHRKLPVVNFPLERKVPFGIGSLMQGISLIDRIIQYLFDYAILPFFTVSDGRYALLI